MCPSSERSFVFTSKDTKIITTKGGGYASVPAGAAGARVALALPEPANLSRGGHDVRQRASHLSSLLCVHTPSMISLSLSLSLHQTRDTMCG